VTDHAASDDTGTAILGEEDQFWRDHKGAGVNAVRTQTLLRRADVVVVRFGDKFRQWNAAFEAGHAAALGRPIITLHDPELTHALKEVAAPRWPSPRPRSRWSRCCATRSRASLHSTISEGWQSG
jgi:YtoQ family protein